MTESPPIVTRQLLARPSDEHVEREAWLALGLASSTSLVVGMAVTAVNVSFPAIERDFAGASRSTLSWGLTGYSIGLASLLLVGGRLADHFGRRRIYRLGVAVFVVASLALALAPAPWVFVASRLGQAVGAAMAGPASLALVIERFPATRRLSAVSAWAALGTLGAAIGPSFAAVITQQFGWRWVFVVPLAACLVAFVAAPRLLPEGLTNRAVGARIDIVGSIVGTAGVACIAAAITEGPRRGWLDPLSLGLLAGAFFLIPAFILRCRRHPEPLLDLRLMARPNVLAVNLVNIAYTAAGAASWLVYPLMMVQHWHYSLLRTGLALTPFPITASVTGIIAGRFAERVGTRRVIAYGAMLPAAGLLWQSMSLDEGSSYWTGIALGAVIFNIGFGIVYSPITALALRSVDQSQIAQASAAFTALRQLGGGLGVATAIAIMGDATEISESSFHTALLATAVIAFSGGVVVLTALRVPPEFRSSRRRS